MKKLKEMKKNNKGFSLVELIVVIAIMVVLVAVLGSTILGYVEKSKYSKDKSALDSINTALKTFVAEPDSTFPTGEVSLKTLIETNDKKGVVAPVLKETFTVTEDAKTGKVTACVFNGNSAAFKGITWEDVKITIIDGAVSILVPVNASEQGDYDAYIAGTAYKGQENATKEAETKEAE